MSKLPLLKTPSAWMPIAASVAMLAFILILLTISGVPTVPAEDEGLGARLFQIWLMFEALMIGVFAARHLPIQRKQTLIILAIQLIAVIAAASPVFILGL